MKKRLRITVNGKTYDVEAEILDDGQRAAQPADSTTVGSAAIAPTKVAASKTRAVSSASASPGEVPSPIAGVVVSIAKSEGSLVAAGDVLLVLEAMKMNTEVTAPGAGTVSKVNVSQGQSVEEGQILITIA